MANTELVITERSNIVAIADAVRANSDITNEISLDEIVNGIKYVADYAAANSGGGINTSDATATADEIMSGETAYANGKKITGTFTIDSELTTQDNLIAQIQTALEGKAGGTTIIEPVLQEKTITPTKSVQTATPDSGYNGLSKVTVNAIPDEYIVPSGIKSITTNGTHDVTAYEAVEVSISGGGGSSQNTINEFLCGTLEQVDCDGCTIVNPYFFYENDGIKTVQLRNATSIGGYNFYACDNLESINLPEATDTVGTYFCYHCDNLISVNIPKVTTLGNYCFQNSAAIALIDLPMVESIGNYAFRYASSLETIILRKTDGVVTLSGSSAFTSTKIASKTGYIYVPSALVDSYKAATNWSKYASQIRAIEDYPEICG